MLHLHYKSIFEQTTTDRRNVEHGKPLGELLEAEADQIYQLWIDGEPLNLDDYAGVVPADGSIISIQLVPADTQNGGMSKETLRQVALLGSVGLGALASSPLSGVASWVAQAGITLAGVWLTNALIPIIEPEEFETFSFGGIKNKLDPYGVIPKLYGKRRITPPLAAAPVTEVVGDDLYSRAVFALGYRPIKTYRDTLRIGNQLLSDLQSSATVEIVDGFESPDEGITLYSNDTEEKRMSIKVNHADDWNGDPNVYFADGTPVGWEPHPELVVLVTEPNTREFNFDLTFPRGIARELSNGGLTPHAIQMAYQYREYNATTPGPWLDMLTPESEQLYNIRAADYTTEFNFTALDNWATVVGNLMTTLEAFGAAHTRFEALATMNDRIARAKAAATNLKGKESITAPQIASVDAVLAVIARAEVLIAGVVATANTNEEDPYPDFFVEFANASIYIGTARDVFKVQAWRFDGFTANNGIASAEVARLNTDREHMPGVFGSSATGIFIAEYEESKGSVVRRNVSFSPGSSATWEIRIRKYSPDPAEDERVLDEVQVTALRSRHDAAWISDDQRDRTALLAIRVKATDQITGNLDQVSIECESPLKWYNGSAWVGPAIEDGSGNSVSRNPAWAYVDALASEANKYKTYTSLLDTPAIYALATWATANNYHYDDYIAKPKALKRILQDILRGAKASPGMLDGEYTLIHDIEKTTPVAVITSRNSRGFTGSKNLASVEQVIKAKRVVIVRDLFQPREHQVVEDGRRVHRAVV